MEEVQRTGAGGTRSFLLGVTTPNSVLSNLEALKLLPLGMFMEVLLRQHRWIK